eukprot:7856530-Pyramimonas_sp.AAC.1
MMHACAQTAVQVGTQVCHGNYHADPHTHCHKARSKKGHEVTGERERERTREREGIHTMYDDDDDDGDDDDDDDDNDD